MPQEGEFWVFFLDLYQKIREEKKKKNWIFHAKKYRLLFNPLHTIFSTFTRLFLLVNDFQLEIPFSHCNWCAVERDILRYTRLYPSPLPNGVKSNILHFHIRLLFFFSIHEILNKDSLILECIIFWLLRVKWMDGKTFFFSLLLSPCFEWIRLGRFRALCQQNKKIPLQWENEISESFEFSVLMETQRELKEPNWVLKSFSTSTTIIATCELARNSWSSKSLWISTVNYTHHQNSSSLERETYDKMRKKCVSK